MVTLDSRLDLLKIGVESMEIEGIGRREVADYVAAAHYRQFTVGPNILAVHETDGTIDHISVSSAGQTEGGIS